MRHTPPPPPTRLLVDVLVLLTVAEAHAGDLRESQRRVVRPRTTSTRPESTALVVETRMSPDTILYSVVGDAVGDATGETPRVGCGEPSAAGVGLPGATDGAELAVIGDAVGLDRLKFCEGFKQRPA